MDAVDSLQEEFVCNLLFRRVAHFGVSGVDDVLEVAVRSFMLIHPFGVRCVVVTGEVRFGIWPPAGLAFTRDP